MEGFEMTYGHKKNLIVKFSSDGDGGVCVIITSATGNHVDDALFSPQATARDLANWLEGRYDY